ncbi:MAG: DUF2889 domain-containing protein [Rhodospirillales bacterium]
MLSKAAPRKLIHSRRIVCHGYRRDDGLWDIEGSLEDTKTYSFANQDRDGIAAGEPIHLMRLRLTLDEDLRVHAVEAWTEAGPFTPCGDIVPSYADLAGLTVGPGWRRRVLERLGGVNGCTHLTELLLGPVTTTAMQSIMAARARREGSGGRRPAVIDTCHALAADGDIVARQWPQFHRPQFHRPKS